VRAFTCRRAAREAGPRADLRHPVGRGAAPRPGGRFPHHPWPIGCVRFQPRPQHLSRRRAPSSLQHISGAAVSSAMRAHTGASPQRKLLLDRSGPSRSRSWLLATYLLMSMPHLYDAGQRSPSRRPLTSCLSLSEPETGQVFTRVARSLIIQGNVIRDVHSSEPLYWRAGRRTVLAGHY
jgi:hypothetical protein